MPDTTNTAASFHEFQVVLLSKLSDISGEKTLIAEQMGSLQESVRGIKTDIALLRRDVEQSSKAAEKLDALEKRVSALELAGAVHTGRQAAMSGIAAIGGAILVFIVQWLLQNAGMKAK